MCIDDAMIKYLLENYSFFVNDIGESYMQNKVNSNERPIKINSRQCERAITQIYFESEGKAIPQDAFKQIISILDIMAINSGQVNKLERRVSKSGDSFYYDFGGAKQLAIRIDKNVCTVDNNPPLIFVKGANMGEQVFPDLDTSPHDLIDFIHKHFRFVNDDECLLFAVYLVSCLIPDIPHPILVLYGEKGAAKSTSMKMVKSIVDPSVIDLFSFPNGRADLALLLSNNHMICFDNLDTITAEKSDMLCMAVTGGAFAKRTLYTNDEMSVFTLKRCVTLNGIGDIVRKSDLLDRSIIIELSRIDNSERKSEKVIWSDFNMDKPKILGACFNALSSAMGIIPTIEIQELQRMADFTHWGYAIAEAIGISGEYFLEAYLNNQYKTNVESISTNPLAASIMFLMKDRLIWEGGVGELLLELERIAYRERLDVNSKEFPRASHVLSKRLTEIKSNLEALGITFGIRHAGSCKKITIKNAKAGT